MIVAVENFLRHLKRIVAATTYQRKMWQLRSFYKYLINHGLHYSQVQQCDVERYLVSLRCSQQAKQQICGVVREFYAYHQWPNNPAAQIVFKPEKRNRLPKVPSQLCIERIIRNLTGENTDLALRNRLMVELAYGSGLRRAELVKLDIDDIDLEGKTAYIKGKGGKHRIVPLTEKAVESIREYLRVRQAYKGPLLASQYNRRLSYGSVNWILKEKAGIRPHVLRHAFAGHMLKNGCGIRVIQELLGHSDLRSTQIYTQISKENLREVVNEKHPGKMR
jgi:site-specific recombinase XerD